MKPFCWISPVRRIQGYDIIDMEEVWHTVETDIPNFIVQLEPFLLKKNEPFFHRSHWIIPGRSFQTKTSFMNLISQVFY